MKKCVWKILILTIILVLCIQIKLFATALTLVTSTDKDFYNLEENVIVTVNWVEAMQAAGFTIKYDSTKLELKSASISDTYYNTETVGLVKVNWASMEEIDYTQMTFTFKAIGGGKTQISVESPNSFADKDLVSPESIDCTTSGTRTITITRYGDVNLDNALNTKDTQLLRQYIDGPYGIELTEQQFKNADVNLDGVIDDLDVEILRRAILGDFILPSRYGDVNLDGKVSEDDAELLLYYIMYPDEYKVQPQGLINADVNLDGKINSNDAVMIKKYLAKEISLPIRYGDVDLDGRIRTLDAVILSRYIEGIYEVELTEKQLINADVNLDGLITKNDVRLIPASIVANKRLPIKVIVGDNIKTYNLDKTQQVISGFYISKNGLSKNEVIKNFNTTIIEEYGAKFFNQNANELVNDNIGTGSIMKIGYYPGVESTQEYTILVYGDTNGDGLITPVDALAIIKDINNKIPFTNEIYRTAGKVYSDAEQELSAIDALAIIKYTNGKYEINQSK